MSGPDCPVCKKPMDMLSTFNQWEYHCRRCDKRYNRKMEACPPDYEPLERRFRE